MIKRNKLLTAAVDLIFPKHCPVCDEILVHSEYLICKKCKGKIKYIKEPVCMKCGKPLYDNDVEYCYDCSLKKHFFVKGMAVFEYNSIASSIYRFKYNGRQEYAEFYGKSVAGQLGEIIMRWEPQALIPVPLHPSKMRSRGYNQAEVLAKALSKETGIPVKRDLVIRCKKTLPQNSLNDEERQNNLKRAFKIYRNDVKLDTIVIIDDIYTTGSTIDAITREMHKAKIENVYYVALAIGKGL